jgi:hypothetical protein
MIKVVKQRQASTPYRWSQKMINLHSLGYVLQTFTPEPGEVRATAQAYRQVSHWTTGGDDFFMAIIAAHDEL